MKAGTGTGIVTIALFTRDLRVHDNPMLAAAAAEAGGNVVPLFVLDDAIAARSLATSGRLLFLHEALADLDASLRGLGTRLVVRRGPLVEEVCRVAAEAGAAAVHISADVSQFAQTREAQLCAALSAQRCRLHVHQQVHTVQAPGSLVPAGRDHFSVFTPYFRRWSETPTRPLANVPRRLRRPVVAVRPLLSGDSGKSGTSSTSSASGGETAGRQRAEDWLTHGIRRYADLHDDLAADATSRLSPYLHFGCVSATELVTRVRESAPCAGSDAFVRQLAWRDFHHQVLAARPDAAREDYRSRDDVWRDDPRAFEAWAQGRTGIPIVDAGMRQLLAEGWMHNRARLITAGFLTKTLYLDWRAGAAHFAAHLVDADVANNAMNWQWSAGTGTDTRPNRVLNPLRQAARYDPTGDYIRRHVAELSDVKHPVDVQQPWRLGEAELRHRRYPAPTVDLDGARRKFLAARTGDSDGDGDGEIGGHSEGMLF